jgi:hypothetical protein
MLKSSVLLLIVAISLPFDVSGAWDTTGWVIVCLPPEDGGFANCDSDSEFSTSVVDQLKGSSAWLSGLGFEEPTITRAIEFDRRWIAFMGDELEVEDRGGTLVAVRGACKPQVMVACFQVERRFGDLGWFNWLAEAQLGPFINPVTGMATIRIGLDIRDDPETNASVPTHELFHGVQYSYGVRATPASLWFYEGTAAAVEAVHYKKHRPDHSEKIDKFGNVLLSGRGYYDHPLERLKNPDKPGLVDYTSYLFWLFIGGELDSGDPILGLRKFFDALEPGSDLVAASDGALESFKRGGLSNYYAEFIAKRADEEEDFEQHVPPLTVFDGTDEDKEDEYEGTVKRLASRFHLVGADPKAAENAALEIKVEGDDSDALHLIVDNDLYNGGTGSKGTEKNVFRTSLTESRIFKVRVANGAEDAASTVEQSYKLTARLIIKEIDCCSCDYAATKTFYPQGDFQCTFEYPAHWEASYDKWDNSVYVKAKRCEKRCGGSRHMAFSISTGKDNNADYQEANATNQVGSLSCGGRSSPVFRPPGTTPEGTSGSIWFHVGNGDGLAYDARAQFSCLEPGEWQELEKLFIGSVK